MQAKLNPQGAIAGDSTSTKGKISFPGFQKVLDFTSAGNESSVSCTVSGDADKEYKILIRNLNGTYNIYLRLNATSTGYGYQSLDNNSGSVSAGRDNATSIEALALTTSICDVTLVTPSSLLKTAIMCSAAYSSGTTIDRLYWRGYVYNSTANITSLDFVPSGGTFASGTRITVLARRS